METVSKRIKKMRKLLGMTQRALADSLEIRPQTVSAWERDLTTPNGKLLGQLAFTLGVTKSWILYGETTDKESKLSQQKSELVHFVKLFDSIQASAGFGFENYNESELVDYPIPREAIQNQPNKNGIFCIRTHGNSMEPVFFEGTVLAVNPSKKQLIDGRIFVVRTNTNLRVKILKENSKGIVLSSFNPSYEDEQILWDDMGSSFAIIGEVFWFSSKIND
ncbi:S24 family peptidase [Vibrio harveyi]|uniref:S24 family peptidase n=1 Tax=Vibrio harveyi TaxID=669 RepID=UPI001E58285F|nr:S24 family peptidase [Vibrio harveyi]